MADRKISTTFTRYKQTISKEELNLLVDKLAQHPDNLDLMDWAAFAFYSHGDMETSVQYYSELIKHFPENASYHYYVASAYFKLGNQDQAEYHWRLVLDIDKDGAFVERARRKLQKGGEVP